MFHNLPPKCSNPGCVTAFEWLSGGRLFRFHREPVQFSSSENRVQVDTNGSHHQVEHFWLCERCAKIYTLEYEPGRGVLLRLLWPELPAAENRMHLPDA
jgi:hypothetical protein